MGTANAAFRAHEGVWTVARTQSLGVGPVNEVDTSPRYAFNAMLSQSSNFYLWLAFSCPSH